MSMPTGNPPLTNCVDWTGRNGGLLAKSQGEEVCSLRACLEVLAGECSYSHTLDQGNGPLLGVVVSFNRANSFEQLREARTWSSEGGRDTSLASQISLIKPVDQGGDRCHNQIALTSRRCVPKLGAAFHPSVFQWRGVSKAEMKARELLILSSFHCTATHWRTEWQNNLPRSMAREWQRWQEASLYSQVQEQLKGCKPSVKTVASKEPPLRRRNLPVLVKTDLNLSLHGSKQTSQLRDHQVL